MPYAASEDMPRELVPSLMFYFSSSQGYMLYPDVESTFQLLRKLKVAAQDESSSMDVSVGVISNSDDRVLPVLSSLGLSTIIPAGAAGTLNRSNDPSLKPGDRTADVDFIALSYDIGFEKPSREIFDAAKSLGNIHNVQARQEKCIHIGDDLEEDFKGAERAGWKGIFLDRKGWPQGGENRISDLTELEPFLDNSFSELRRLRHLRHKSETADPYRKLDS